MDPTAEHNLAVRRRLGLFFIADYFSGGDTCADVLECEMSDAR